MRTLLLCLTLAAAPALAQVELRLEPPRSHGWWLGDVLVHRALVLLPEGTAIDPASLPKAGEVEYWLDLVAVDHAPTRAEGRPAAVITTRWQSFYAPLEPVWREVPAWRLRLTDGTAAVIPAWGFVTSPIRPILAPSAPAEMQPDAGVTLARAAELRRMTLGFGLLATLALAALAHHQSWWPFRPGPARPFTRASRALARAADPRLGALALHRAFDAARGRSVLAADVEDFLADWPDFRPLASEIAMFFDRSAQIFFGDGSAGAEDLDRARRLARRLAAIERGRA